MSGRLQARRVRALHLLYGLPAGVEVAVGALTVTLAEHAGVRAGPAAHRCVAAAFLDPLVALGAAQIEPSPAVAAARVRLGPTAATVIGAALVAAGEPARLRAAEAN